MAARTNRSDLDPLFRSLVAYRVFIYVGGLVAIALPRILRTVAGIDLAASVRTLIVAASLGVMILTYLGERRVGLDEEPKPTASDPSSGGDGESREYSRRTRTTVAIGLVGLAIGIYVAVEVNLLIGLLFIAGGLLFGQSAYRGGSEGS